jgi:ferredoxin
MRIVVDRDRCTGQAMCESIASDIFQVNDDGELELQVAVVPDDRLGQAKWAVTCCPNEALQLVP